MTVRMLEKQAWHPFFDHLSKMLEGCQAEIEATSLGLGDQVQASWLPLLGLVYDPKGRRRQVALMGLTI